MHQQTNRVKRMITWFINYDIRVHSSRVHEANILFRGNSNYRQNYDFSFDNNNSIIFDRLN